MKISRLEIGFSAFTVVALLLCVFPPRLHAAGDTKRPEVWMGPPSNHDGEAFRTLFVNPDKWPETRSNLDGIVYADHFLNSQFTDAELKAWLPLVNNWHLKLGLEVGAIKPWGPTGEQAFKKDRIKWDRFQAMGGKIYELVMDEPFCAVRKQLHKVDDYAVEETANFIALVRASYPDVLIGDVEPYPFFSSDELVWFVDALQSKLRQMNVRGLDFFRVDVDWANFGPSALPASQEKWKGVQALETLFRKRNIPFGIIYWAADYPRRQRSGVARDSTWYESTMQQGKEYAVVGGNPDQIVVESWLQTPNAIVPETDQWTFTRSVLDFIHVYARKK